MSLCAALLLLAADDGAAAAAAAPAAAAQLDVDPPAEDVVLDAWLFSDESYRLRGATGDGADRFGGFDHDVRWLLDGGARSADGQLGVDASGALFWDVDGASPP